PENSLPYAVLDLTGGFENYLKALSRKFRLHLNRLRSKARREQITVTELKPQSLDPDSLPGVFWALHESRFKTTSLRSVCKTPEEWIYNLFPALFAEGRMRVFAVIVKTQIVGIDLGMVTRSGMYAWNGGFRPEIRSYDPGKLLICKAIEQCCME